MIGYKLLLILSEGLVFGLFALGVYVAFQWLRFPDLTPDGSFVIGACFYVKAVGLGASPLFALLSSIVGGVLAGFVTAALNKLIRIPTVVAGLLTSAALYSLSWLVLGKPNQFLDPNFTLIGDVGGFTGALQLTCWLLAFSVSAIILLAVFGETFWGLKARAIGENPLLARDLKTHETTYTFLCLAVANGIVALSGALFAQRSFSADINMGIGQTIIGLIGMILGLLISNNRRKVFVVLSAVVIGAILHKSVIFLTLEAGMPAESFRLVSALLFVLLFFAIRASGIEFGKGLKWS